MKPEALWVWLDGLHIATIQQTRGGRIHLEYTEAALNRYPPGIPLLSLKLPLIAGRHSHGVVRPFLEGLLPEGEPRLAIAASRHVDPHDTYTFIGEIGRECAGALAIVPSDEPVPVEITTDAAARLSEVELETLVADLRSAPLGAGPEVRISLAGVQEKLLLVRRRDGGWARPQEGLPSTHILKPERADYPDIVENEAFCMRLASHLGLPVAAVETIAVAGRKMIVVERYDRKALEDGTISRIHQEDFCQALAVLPEQKYESQGGPSLRQIAQILTTFAPTGSLETLLRAVTLNVLVGNCDAHGKNLSLLHDPPGTVRLAPLYDLLATGVYGAKTLSMNIDGLSLIDGVDADRIMNEAVNWGVRKSDAAEVVRDIIARAPGAAAAAARELADGGSHVRTHVEARIARLSGSPSSIAQSG